MGCADEVAAGFLGGIGGSDSGGERVLMQPLDHGAEQRFLGLEVMVERLPRQPRGLRRLLDRRPPKAMVAKHGHRGVKNTGPGAHLTILTKMDEMSNDGGVRGRRADRRGPIRCERLT